MFGRVSAKALLLAFAVALVFFGVGLIGLAIAAALAPRFGAAGGDALAGLILLGPPLIWALAITINSMEKAEAAPSGGRELMNSLIAAMARETPWVAVLGAGLVGAANLFLNRNKRKK
jgi:hypothetical protein